MYSIQYRESLNSGPMTEAIKLVLFYSIKLTLLKKLRPFETQKNYGHCPEMHCLLVAPNTSENVSYTSEILIFWCLDTFNIIIFLQQHSPKQCVSSAQGRPHSWPSVFLFLKSSRRYSVLISCTFWKSLKLGMGDAWKIGKSPLALYLHPQRWEHPYSVLFV